MRFVALAAAISLGPPVGAQIGGTGVDGPFAPTANTTLSTARGRYDFTTISIPAGVTVRLAGPNPAVLYCQGAVTVAGVLDADGEGAPASLNTPGAGGPGGYAGGAGDPGGFRIGSNGQGPGGGPGGSTCGLLCPSGEGGGGGHATEGINRSGNGLPPGARYGSALPFDARGGSGGGGAAALFGLGIGGSGGGGVVVILADGPISVSGAVTARGADNNDQGIAPVNGGAGAGGSILLRSLQSVSVTGTVDAAGGLGRRSLFPALPSGGDGFVRIDAYGATPQLGGTITPAPLALRLPHLDQTAPPAVGRPWTLLAAAVPGDVVSFFLSPGMASIPAPPFGTILLDPRAGIVPLGNALVPAAGLDPIASLTLAVPNVPGLAGATFCAQAINHLGTATGRPRLSDALCVSIQP